MAGPIGLPIITFSLTKKQVSGVFKSSSGVPVMGWLYVRVCCPRAGFLKMVYDNCSVAEEDSRWWVGRGGRRGSVVGGRWSVVGPGRTVIRADGGGWIAFCTSVPTWR